MTQSETDHYYEHGYAVISAAAPPEVARNLLSLIQLQLNAARGGVQSFLAEPRVNTKPAYEFYSYRHPLVLGFHFGLTSRIAELTGKRLAPTYAFFRTYQQGDKCTVHSDREACEHSFSMPLAYGDNIVWPFEVGKQHYDFEIACDMGKFMDFGDEPSKEVLLNPGDAILYQGCNRRHGRTTPNPNRWSAHLFLHWVDLDGPFKAWAFDHQNFPPVGDFQFPNA